MLYNLVLNSVSPPLPLWCFDPVSGEYLMVISTKNKKINILQDIDQRNGGFSENHPFTLMAY